MTNQFMEFKVRHISRGGSAYGTNMDTGEEVFINSSLVAGEDMQVGDYIKAMVVINEKSDDIKWYARVIEIVE